MEPTGQPRTQAASRCAGTMATYLSRSRSMRTTCCPLTHGYTCGARRYGCISPPGLSEAPSRRILEAICSKSQVPGIAVAGVLSTPATLAIYPSLFHLKGAGTTPNATEVSAEIATLIGRGLRARLARNPPLVGSYQVSLEIVPGGKGPATPLMADGMPQIPAAEGGGVDSIVTRINKVPIERISQNLLNITAHVSALTSSPHLKDAVVQLDAALRQIHRLTAKAGPQVPIVIARLRRAAADLDATTKSANRLMSGTATQNGLTDTVQEISETARAVRSLADYLDRHPEALIRGRAGDMR